MTMNDTVARELDSFSLPLFYREPHLLHSEANASWRLKEGDMSFAASTAFVPIVVGELAAAARDYPIVFAAGNSAPIAVLGLENANLFLSGGTWQADAYVPAYVRRYPFGFVETENPKGFALAIDAGSDRVAQTGEDGAALFEDGKPSALTQQALRFCDAFQGETKATADFVKALAASGMLIDRRADATLPDGRKFGIEGFQIVDATKLRHLDGPTIVEWHNKGWLALIHFHLQSLERFPDLLDRQTKRLSTLA